MLRGVIFDMDGVISDTQKLHSKVESELLAEYGIDLDPGEITRKYSGVRTKDFFRDLLDEKGVKDYDLDLIIERKWDRLIVLAWEEVEAVPGALRLIHDLSKEGFALAVASASVSSYVEVVLDRLEVFDRFQAIVSGDDVEHGKPAPDSFLRAAELMGLKSHECLVIEDGRSGMQAAATAGMKCIGLVTDLNAEYPPVTLRTTSLEALNISILKNL